MFMKDKELNNDIAKDPDILYISFIIKKNLKNL